MSASGSCWTRRLRRRTCSVPSKRTIKSPPLAGQAGWEYGGTIAGHLVGEFPHEKIAGDETGSYIAPGSREPMRRLDRTGRRCHWILEIHLVDRGRQIGGFHEELLDLGN